MIEVTFKNTETGATARGYIEPDCQTELVDFLNGKGNLTIGGIYPVEVYAGETGQNPELLEV